MKKLFILLSLSMLIQTIAFCQPRFTTPEESESHSKFYDHFFFGGNIGLQFGTETVVLLNPMFGYHVTERLAVGVGIKYIYFHTTDYITNEPYSTDIYGGSVFTRYFLLENVFAHAEYEVLNLEAPDPLYGFLRRVNVPIFLLGGGYRQMIGEHSSINLEILFDVANDINSPYPNPIIRVGFGFGI